MLSEAQLKVLIHRIEARIPDRIKDFYDDTENRRRISIKYGADKAFLDSNELKFVVIDPTNGKYRCDLVLLAIFKALWNIHRNTKKPTAYYKNMLHKAKDLYKTISCQDILEDKFNLPNGFDIQDLQ
jgi:hypothetical protein